MSKHDVRQADWVSEDGGGSGFLPSPVQPVIGVQTDLPGSDTSSLSLLHPWTALPTQTIGESCLSLSCNTGVTDTFTLGLLKVSCCESWIGGWISCSDHIYRQKSPQYPWMIRQIPLVYEPEISGTFWKLCEENWNCADSFWFVENSFSLFVVSMWRPNDEKCLVKTLDHSGPEPRLELFSFVCFSFFEGAWDRSTRSVKDFESCSCTWLNLMRCQLTLPSMLCIRGEQQDL